jgi:hypothetical protein
MQHKPLTKSRLLNSQGWEARVESSLLNAQDDWRNSAEFRSHGHTLRRLFDDLKLDAVLCVAGRPTVCVKDARELSEDEIARLRGALWNLGSATLLMVEQKTKVLLFSTLVTPSRKDDRTAITPELTNETIASLEDAELTLRLRQFIRRVETGAIYRDNKQLFDPKQVVDKVLLRNLSAARNLICQEVSVKDYRRAHALIGRFLFSCYLFDRRIIGDSYLSKKGLTSIKDMSGLLDSSRSDRVDALVKLFAALHRDFNGSLFGDEDTTVTEAEVDILQRFLSGEDLQRQQMALPFKLYDFSFIPVEFISSIYQEFLGAEAEVEAQPTGRNQLRNHGQRRQGAYYTPPRLAELTVDIATDGWDTLLNKRCLDPACGSGVFLVILFVRMAEEWRMRNPHADTCRRYDELMRLLAENICGVDIQHTACLITCFSLYLAFLDQMEPREIEELRDALNRDSRKILPRIFWEHAKNPPAIRTIRELDFFELPSNKDFDLVVGNPPWVSRRDEESHSAAAWVLSEQRNPAAKGLKKSVSIRTLLPGKEVACGFMWKAGLHTKSDGRVCQVLPSRVFLSNNTDRFQAHWLNRHRLESVWLLADYSFILFPGADCPCFIGRYHLRCKEEPLGEFEFITPKVELIDPREALIPVQPEDQKVMSEQEIVVAAEKTECALAWKRQHWGTLRDLRLIDRLMRLPKLSRMTFRVPRSEKAVAMRQPFHWYKGQGFQPATESTLTKRDEPAPVFWAETDRFLSARTIVSNLVITSKDTVPIGTRYKESGLLFPRNKLIYKAPLLLINKACTKFLFSDFDVLFQDDFQSICASKNEEDELLFLTAVFASPLAQYLLFHTTANIGIERDIARFEELLELPFPLPADMPDVKRSKAIVVECAEILRNLKAQLSKPERLLDRDGLVEEARRELDTRVYAYFSICEWERYLIEDTVNVFRPSSTPGALYSEKLFTQKPSDQDGRKAYADTLVATFRGWTRSKLNLWAFTTLAPNTQLGVVTFGVGGRSRDYSEKRAEQRVEDLLDRIRNSSTSSEGTVFRCLRGFVFYEGTQVHLLKPLNRRYWTRTAALNDADGIIAHMMQEDGWSV